MMTIIMISNDDDDHEDWRWCEIFSRFNWGACDGPDHAGHSYMDAE